MRDNVVRYRAGKLKKLAPEYLEFEAIIPFIATLPTVAERPPVKAGPGTAMKSPLAVSDVESLGFGLTPTLTHKAPL